MNNRLLKTPVTSKSRPPTVRSHVTATLAREILDNPSTNAFLIESEHQLCRRFSASRVTVRLALSDLERQGLIYRKHGKGTFAFGKSTQLYRSIVILLKAPLDAENDSITEIIRGVHAVTLALRSATILMTTSPDKWEPATTCTMGGVLVVPQNVSQEELENLKDRRLPFLIIGKSHLCGPRFVLNEEEPLACGESHFFSAGRRAAEILSRAAFTGCTVLDLMIYPIMSSEQPTEVLPRAYLSGDRQL